MPIHKFAAVTFLLTTLVHARANEPFIAEVPFHDCRGLICIDVALDGAKPRTLLFDTGNVGSVLMTDSARTLGWKLDPVEQNGKTVPGYFRSGEHHASLGDTKLDVKFVVLDRSKFGKDPPPADGTIDYTAFKDRIVQIDYPRHMLRISAVATSSPKEPVATADVAGHTNAPGTLQLITFGKKGPPILVGAPFTINGKRVHAQIDTCYTGTMLVYDAAIEQLGLKELARQGAPEFFVDTDGGVNMLAAHAQTLGFASTPLLQQSPKVYFPTEGVHQPDALFEATVGNALFTHSVVTLDFHAMTMDVKPEA